MCKGSSSTPANTTTTTSQPSPDVTAAYNKVVGKAQTAAGAPLQQYSGPMIAGFTPAQLSSFKSVDNTQGVANPYINSASQYAAASATPITPTAFSPGAVSQYESPYTKQVVDATQAQYNNQNAVQQAALQGNAISKGAWGGDRAGIAQAELANQQQLAQAPVIAGLQNQGYSQALGEFNTQQTTGVGAQEASGWLNSNAGYAMGNLGNEAQNTALSGANAQLQSGALQQQLGQEQLNIPYEQFLQQQAYPFQTTNFLAGVTEGTGSLQGGTSSTTSPGPSTAGQVAGLGLAGIAGLGATNAFGSAGSSGWLFHRGGRIYRASGGGLPEIPDVSIDYIPHSSRQAPRGGGPPPPPKAVTPENPTALGLNYLGMMKNFMPSHGANTASALSSNPFSDAYIAPSSTGANFTSEAALLGDTGDYSSALGDAAMMFARGGRIHRALGGDSPMISGYTAAPGHPNISIPVLGTGAAPQSAPTAGFATPTPQVGTNTAVAPSAGGTNINSLYNWSPPTSTPTSPSTAGGWFPAVTQPTSDTSPQIAQNAPPTIPPATIAPPPVTTPQVAQRPPPRPAAPAPAPWTQADTVEQNRWDRAEYSGRAFGGRLSRAGGGSALISGFRPAPGHPDIMIPILGNTDNGPLDINPTSYWYPPGSNIPVPISKTGTDATQTTTPSGTDTGTASDTQGHDSGSGHDSGAGLGGGGGNVGGGLSGLGGSSSGNLGSAIGSTPGAQTVGTNTGNIAGTALAGLGLPGVGTMAGTVGAMTDINAGLPAGVSVNASDVPGLAVANSPFGAMGRLMGFDPGISNSQAEANALNSAVSRNPGALGNDVTQSDVNKAIDAAASTNTDTSAADPNAGADVTREKLADPSGPAPDSTGDKANAPDPSGDKYGGESDRGGQGGGSSGGDHSDGGGDHGDACFIGETPILMGDFSWKSIKDVAVGDLVMAFEGAGPLESCRVTDVRSHEGRKVTDIGVGVTGEHPFLRPDGSWINAEDIGIGTQVLFEDGEPYTVWAVLPVEGLHTVHNLTVDRLHTYIAGGFRVHNSKRYGGTVRRHRDMGGMTAAAGAYGSGAPISGGNPIAQQQMSGLSQMPTEKLQELSQRIPPTSQQGALIQRALMSKRMNPGTAPNPIQGFAQAPSPYGGGMAFGGRAGFDDGGDVAPTQGNLLGGMTDEELIGSRDSPNYSPTLIQKEIDRRDLGSGFGNVVGGAAKRIGSYILGSGAAGEPNQESGEAAGRQVTKGVGDVADWFTEPVARPWAGMREEPESRRSTKPNYSRDALGTAEPPPAEVRTPAEIAGLRRPVTGLQAAPPAGEAAPVMPAKKPPAPVQVEPGLAAKPLPAEPDSGRPHEGTMPPAPSAAPSPVAGLQPTAAVSPAEAAHRPGLADSPWLALATAGARMASSRSPYFAGALGEGIEEGAKTLGQQSAAAREQQRVDQTAAFQRAEIESRNKGYDVAGKRLAMEAAHHAATLKMENDRNAETAKYHQGLLDREKIQVTPGYGPGPDGQTVAGTYHVDRNTDKSTFHPGEIYQTVATRPSAHEQARTAWLSLHPGDEQGALDYASGHRQMSEEEVNKAAMNAARQEFAISGIKPSDAVLDARAAQHAQQLRHGFGAAPPAPTKPLGDDIKQQYDAAIAAGKPKDELIKRLQQNGYDTTGL